MFKKLSGMTGTAENRSDRVRQHLQTRRHRHPDEQNRCCASRIPTSFYRTEREKYFAVADEIQKAQRNWPAGSRGHNFD